MKSLDLSSGFNVIELSDEEAGKITGGIGVPDFIEDAAEAFSGGVIRFIDGANAYHTDTYEDSDFWYDAGHATIATVTNVSFA